MVLSQCQFTNELYSKNIDCADVLLLNPSDSPQKNFFCYKSILPVSIREALGTCACSCAHSVSLSLPSSRVSAGTEAAGGTEASCSLSGTHCPWVDCACTHGCCTSRAKKATPPQQHQRQRRQPARRVGPLTRATGQWYCRDNPGQDPSDLRTRAVRMIVIKPNPWTEDRHTLLMLEIRLVCL